MSVTYTVDGHVGIITIDRPEARNAIDDVVAHGIEDAVDEIESRDEIFLGIITGVPPVFSAGADLKMVNAGRGSDLSTKRGGFAGLVARERTKPLIAAVDGPALAGGTEIVLACDIVVASTAARFGVPEVKRSLVAAAGGLFRLPRKIPVNIAMECALTGQPISAEQAAHFGLVNRLCDTGEALATALGLAAEICGNAPVAVRETRRIVLGSLGNDDELGWRLSEEGLQAAFASEDFKEGMNAFIEKRDPVWTGK